MENSSIPSERQGSFPSTELTHRLLRRAEEPIGVIDTRPAEQIHARTARWVAGKLDLLERYATRYGIVEAVPQGTPTTLLRSGSTWPVESSAHVTSAELPATFSPEPWAASAAGKISLPEQGEVRQDRQSSDSGEFTVRRTKGPVSKGASQPSPQVKEIPGQTSSSPVNLHLRRNPLERTSANAEGVAAGSLVPSATSAETVAAHDSPRIKPENASSTMFESTPLVAGSKPLPLVRERKLSDTPPILQRKQTQVPNPVTIHVPEIVDDGTAGDVSAHPETRQATDGSKTAQSIGPPLVVRETYPGKAPAQPATLIFRSTDGRSPATGLDGSQNRSMLSGSARGQVPAVLRETTTAVSSGTSEVSLIGGPQAQSGGSGIDVAEVAEQVSRLIARQLKVDRERRGRVR